MKLFMYSIFDSASGVYDRPFCALTDAAAIRSFADIAVDESTPIGRHPEDFSLFRVGLFDDNKGAIEPQNAECISRAHELAASRGVVTDFAAVGGNA